MLYKIAITFFPNIGSVITRRLLKHFKTLDDVFKASKNDLIALTGIGEKLAMDIISNKTKAIARAEKELEFIQKNGIKVLFIHDNQYPLNLKECPDAPIVLYCKGSFNYSDYKKLGMVGIRNSNNYGKILCRSLLTSFKSKLVTISGLAAGIDTIVHTESLINNIPTIAVLGHGLDSIYPKFNSKLSSEIVNNGALVTEFPSGTLINRINFPKRNRIIAGLSDALIVIEAAERSGALITANLANEYNREVFACPGRVDDPLSAGCNKLIFNNKAHIATSGANINYIMGWQEDNLVDNKLVTTPPTYIIDNLTNTEKSIYILISENKKSNLNTINNSLKIDTSDILVSLLNMELNNLIIQLPGDTYSLVNQDF
ncbi:MAG: DNA-processing protein DprA [Solitalea-like symbiont of Acarus siro]